MSIISWSPETDVDLANAGGQDLASVARLGDGGAGSNNGFAIAWAEQTDSGWSIKGQVYGADGQPIGSELTIATGIADLLSVDARQTRGSGGSFTVTWNDGTSYQSRVFDNSGTPIGGPGPALEAFDENYAHLGSATEVQLAVVDDDVIATVMSAHLSLDPFPVNSTPLSGDTATSVARIGGDWRFAAAWASTNEDGEYEVRVSSFFVGTEPATALHPETLVGTGLGTTPVQPEVVSVNGGGFIVIWLDGDAGQIEAQEFSLSGERLGDVFVVNDLPLGNIDDVKISAISVIDGRVVVTWETAGDVHMKILDPSAIAGGPGDDELVGTTGNDILIGNEGDDDLSGLDGHDRLSGGAGSDHLVGGNGNDELDGGADDDVLEGGSGDDTYFVDNSQDAIVELAGQGSDRVRASASFTLNDGAHVEVVETNDPAGTLGINLTGNDLANTVVGNAGANTLDGGSGGPDLLEGLGGDDTYLVKTGDVILETSTGGFDTVIARENFQLNVSAHVELIRTESAGSTSSINLSGNSFANVLQGNAGINVLDGGAGADQMTGFGGNDIYVVDNAGDVVLEAAGGGYDRVLSSVDYALGAHVEQLDLLGTANINGTGNDLANSLIGNSGNNVLNGAGGADYLVGNGGNDTFVVDSAGDLVVERGLGDGYDRVLSFINFRLGADVEQLDLLGTADLDGTGNNLANTLVGNSGDNILNGKGGADYMVGNGGNDTFVVDDAGDLVLERSASDGYDRVISYIDYRLGANVEQLDLFGSADLDATGNDLANSLIGNSGDNILNGRGGADYMVGNGGDDTFIVDNSGDQVVERSAADGYDRVNSSIDYRLGAHVEQLVLVGSADLDGTGNDLANTLVGNSGDNVLNGKGGADYMVGNGGDDTFIVDDAGDQVVERSAADGIDRVTSSVDYRLGAHVEQLVLAGSDAIDGTGNELANIIVGNSAANVLSGREGADDLNGAGGNDRLIGGAGNDILRGGAGSDGFYFGAPLDWLENVDTIADFVAADDGIFLDNAVFSAFGKTGAIAEDAFVMGSTAQDAEDRLVYDQSTGNIFYDADGAGGADAVLFAQVAPATTLTYADFFVF